jgi:hypothetical protein
VAESRRLTADLYLSFRWYSPYIKPVDFSLTRSTIPPSSAERVSVRQQPCRIFSFRDREPLNPPRILRVLCALLCELCVKGFSLCFLEIDRRTWGEKEEGIVDFPKNANRLEINTSKSVSKQSVLTHTESTLTKN